jgi:hypothetical protein
MTQYPMRVTVSPDMIQKSTRLFNGTPQDIINELFQNSRRAGATIITVDAVISGNVCSISITDNGCGIDHPGKVVTLGTSAWGQDVITREDPAGMGLFSLAGKHVDVETITHAGKAFRLVLSPAAWTGNELVPIDFNIAPDFPHGTRLRFDFAFTNDRYGVKHIDVLQSIVAKAARFLPVQVKFNSILCEQTDFLADALHIEETRGLRIGIFENKYSRYNPYYPAINFFGLTLIYNNLPTLEEVGKLHSLSCKIDIIDCPALKLVLPARKELLMNAFIPEMETACKRALFTVIAKQDHHALSFDDYSKGLALGIDLPEARATLKNWTPSICDSDAGSFTDYNARADLAAAEASYLIAPSFSVPSEQTLHRALDLNKPFAFTLVETQDQFVGYSWYDAIPVLREMSITAMYDKKLIDGDSAYERAKNLDTCRPDQINLALTIHHIIGEADKEAITLHTDLWLLDDTDCYSDPADMPVLVRKNTDLTIGSLESYMTDAYFSVFNDVDADSSYTQRSNWEHACQPAAIALLFSREEAKMVEIKAAVERAISGLVSNDASLKIHFSDGEAKIDMTPPGPDTSTANKADNNNSEEPLCKMLTISTAHLSQETCNHALPQLCRTLPVWDKSEYGWFMYAHLEQLELGGDISTDLQNVLQYARARGCDYIMLDKDWPISSDLALFDWE